MPTEKVYALIPRRTDPEVHVLDEKNAYPSMERVTKTFEGTLHAIGDVALKRAYLSVNARRTDLEDELRKDNPEVDTVFVYETQPLPDDVIFHEGYKWSDQDPTR